MDDMMKQPISDFRCNLNKTTRDLYTKILEGAVHEMPLYKWNIHETVCRLFQILGHTEEVHSQNVLPTKSMHRDLQSFDDTIYFEGAFWEHSSLDILGEFLDTRCLLGF